MIEIILYIIIILLICSFHILLRVVLKKHIKLSARISLVISATIIGLYCVLLFLHNYNLYPPGYLSNIYILIILNIALAVIFSTAPLKGNSSKILWGSMLVLINFATLFYAAEYIGSSTKRLLYSNDKYRVECYIDGAVNPSLFVNHLIYEKRYSLNNNTNIFIGSNITKERIEKIEIIEKIDSIDIEFTLKGRTDTLKKYQFTVLK
jgi:hypothetical protein